MHDVLGMGPDAAENAEDALHEEGRLHEALIDEMGERVEVADVVALDLEARAVIGAGGEDSSISAKVFLKMRSFELSR